jgi:Zn-dependent peptidase ImmA (M78 family)
VNAREDEMMADKAAYYGLMRDLAREKRAEFAIQTRAFGIREIRGVYRRENITIDFRKLPSCLKAIYVVQGGDVSVAIRKDLPEEPKLFALAHELKHHWADQELIRSGLVRCGDYNANELAEIGAEVFAAELIYPEEEFLQDAEACNEAEWTPEDIVRFKKFHCRAKVSYTFIRKRLERRGLVQRDQFSRVRFQKLEEEIYGVPFYKQPWFKQRRAPSR